MPLRSTARDGGVGASKSLATAELERTRKQRDIKRAKGQTGKHRRWWSSCEPWRLLVVAMVMKN